MQPIANRIIELVIKRLHGELNETESLELQDWINQSEENYKAVEDFLDEKKLREGIGNLYKSRETTWQRLSREIPGKQHAPVRRLLIRYSAAAAVLISLFSLGYYFLFDRTLSSTASTTDTLHQNVQFDAVPGGSKAFLMFGDSSVVVLDSVARGAFAQQGNTRLIKSDHGQLVYEQGPSAVPGPVTYNTLTTPRGGQYTLQLPDGSKVWLNAASSLRFPTAFAGRERSIQLTGEAYFEIAKDVTKPFKVSIVAAAGIKQGEVEVVGTHFNINAYGDEPIIKTTLIEGEVKVSATANNKYTLLPGQQGQIINNDVSVIKNADVQEAVAWKDGVFQLTSADIQTIMRQIARWYDVEVVYENGVPAGHITGKVSRNMRLSNVLKVLEISGMHFRIEDKKVIVLP